MFIADTGNSRIREVNRSTGTITTVAGDATPGFTGDNGAATAAELYCPAGLAVDTGGNLFICDWFNSRIREVNPSTHVITTVAGGGSKGLGDNGPATAAQLALPNGVALDAAGQWFIADSDANRVREVNPATGRITTVAGNGTYGYSGDGGQATTAELNWLASVAVDSCGDLLVADTNNPSVNNINNARVRRIDLVTGVITTVAGGGYYSSDRATKAMLDDPSGVAADALETCSSPTRWTIAYARSTPRA